MLNQLKMVPTYVWTFIALLSGIVLGGLYPQRLGIIARGAQGFIDIIVLLVPLLIFFALSPATAMLIRRGLAGRFATSVVTWYIVSSVVAGLFALIVSGLLFNIPFTREGVVPWEEAWGMLSELGTDDGGASYALIAIGAAIVGAIVSIRIDALFKILQKMKRGLDKAGKIFGYVFIPLILAFGIMIGVQFGAQTGMAHYGTMIAYTILLTGIWWAFYVFVLVRILTRDPTRPLLTKYYIPTALFAAGTCSSMATLPVNLHHAKEYGVREEVADFVIPFGAVANMDASALAYMAYGPFLIAHVFGFDVSWSMLIVAWPVIAIYSMGAPGLPAGMGTALWSAVLFSGMLGLEDPERSTFVGTWIALASGIPDMFRSATNSTGDGFVAVIFHSIFDRFFGGEAVPAGMAESFEVGEGKQG